MKIQAVRRLQFCAGHRVHKHESKCNNMHGHNYVVFLHAEAPELDDRGRVIDFSVLKAKFGDWIDKNWDHGFIFKAEDEEVMAALDAVHKQKRYQMRDNPTAENMARHLLLDVAPSILAGTDVVLTKVVLWETENCFVEVTHDN